MEDVIESLMNGDDLYPRSFVSAREFWENFLASHADDDDETLQKAVDNAQLPFQWKLEKDVGLQAPFAKSIMALTAIGSLYKDGFEDREFAERLIKCFTKSGSLSTGVKASAEEVGRIYRLS